jgi:hypothetical protein
MRPAAGRLNFLRLIVYQRCLIPLAFLIAEIKDIKTIKTDGSKKLQWVTFPRELAVCNIGQAVAECNTSRPAYRLFAIRSEDIFRQLPSLIEAELARLDEVP